VAPSCQLQRSPPVSRSMPVLCSVCQELRPVVSTLAPTSVHKQPVFLDGSGRNRVPHPQTKTHSHAYPRLPARQRSVLLAINDDVLTNEGIFIFDMDANRDAIGAVLS